MPRHRSAAPLLQILIQAQIPERRQHRPNDDLPLRRADLREPPINVQPGHRHQEMRVTILSTLVQANLRTQLRGGTKTLIAQRREGVDSLSDRFFPAASISPASFSNSLSGSLTGGRSNWTSVSRSSCSRRSVSADFTPLGPDPPCQEHRP